MDLRDRRIYYDLSDAANVRLKLMIKDELSQEHQGLLFAAPDRSEHLETAAPRPGEPFLRLVANVDNIAILHDIVLTFQLHCVCGICRFYAAVLGKVLIMRYFCTNKSFCNIAMYGVGSAQRRAAAT